jgi:thymidylate synthase ThyX
MTNPEDIFTNLSSNVFGIMGLPEVIKGALFSRYSRSKLGLRDLYTQEFSSLDAEVNADKFYDRILLGYGDDSVAELGSAHVACEDISFIAAKALEQNRVGISPLEKSTRYVPYDEKTSEGLYKYYTPDFKTLAKYSNALQKEYVAVMQQVFDIYSDLISKVLPYVRELFPKDHSTTDRAYNAATKAKALDLLRGLLPMATKTNVGLHGNGRAFEYLLTKMYTNPIPEVSSLAAYLETALSAVIKPFVKRVSSKKGQDYTDYLVQRRINMYNFVPADPPNFSKPSVTLFCKEEEWLNIWTTISSWILVEHGICATLQQAKDYIAVNLKYYRDVYNLVKTYVGRREFRQHKVGRAFESVTFDLDIVLDVGAWRDLQRHRQLTQVNPMLRFPTGSSYYIPEDLPDFAKQDYAKALNLLMGLYDKVQAKCGDDIAQYCVPLAAYCSWPIRLSLREAVFLCELRAGEQGHPTYRWVAQEIYRAIHSQVPELAELLFTHINLKPSVNLERLSAEQQTDKKALGLAASTKV